MNDLPDSIAWISLNNGKANAIDSELLELLNRQLDRTQDSDTKAIVITGYESFFSAGLNLKSLPDDRDGMEAFIRDFEATIERVWSLELPVVSAINGHAIAGGCILACCGDRRIGITGRYKLGVSEVSLGIVFPSIAFEVMRATLSPKCASQVLLGGRLMSPEQAVEAGILDRIVGEEEFRQQVLSEAMSLAEKPAFAFGHSKTALRSIALERASSRRQECRRLFLETWFSAEVTERRRALLESS